MNEGDQKRVLRVSDLRVHYPLRTGILHLGDPPTLKAVDGVSFELAQGEVLGLVGESGCGKSSLGRAVLRLHEPTAGAIEVDGTDFSALHGRALRKFRPRIQMIFQDPYASLNPRMTIFETLAEPIKTHNNLSREAIGARIHVTMDRVGLSAKSLKKYPHEFSGGQRQRIAIARALVLEPKILIADEPVSSLDVSVQAQILNLLREIRKEMGLSMIFISHNLAVVKYISDRIAVMYLGKIVETADCDALYADPQHPYTQALVSAVPIPDPHKERRRRRIALTGELPSPMNPPRGCTFHTRCPLAQEKCREEVPALKEYKEGGWKVSCFEAEKAARLRKEWGGGR